MATVNFLYRSKRPEAFLNLRLLFRHNNKDYSIGGKTKLKVSKDYWANYHGKNSKDAELKKLQNDITNKLFDIETLVIEGFNNSDPKNVNKEFENRYKELIESYNQLKKEVECNNIIYNIDIKFKPVIGKSYYLYFENDNYLMSLISPFEWRKKSLGTFKIDHNGKWNKIEEYE